MTDDTIDDVRRAWAARHPDLDTSPLEVFGRIRRIAALIQLESDRVLTVHNVSRADFDILSAIARSGRPLTPTEIAVETLTSAPGTTKRLQRLISVGLVTRAPNPDDGRGALIELTPSAEHLILPVLRDLSGLEKSLVGLLSGEEQKAVAGGLKTILIDLEREPET